MTTTDTHKPSDPPMPHETGVAPQSTPPLTEKHQDPGPDNDPIPNIQSPLKARIAVGTHQSCLHCLTSKSANSPRQHREPAMIDALLAPAVVVGIDGSKAVRRPLQVFGQKCGIARSFRDWNRRQPLRFGQSRSRRVLSGCAKITYSH